MLLNNMAAREGFARIRKVLAVISTLWAAACVAMFWSFAVEHTLGEFLFFLFVAAVPIGAAWGLLWVIEGFMLKKDAS
jgi:Na+/melibiose symporter-like transporter